MRGKKLILSEEEKSDIISFYKECHSLNDTSEKFNIPAGTIYGHFKKWGVDTPKDYEVISKKIRKFVIKDNHYFEEINTREKAYVLGWLYSDGSMNDKTNCRQIRLKIADLDMLQKINSIFYSDRGLFHIEKEKLNYKQCKLMVISSNKMFDDLVKLGCTPRKSLTKKFPLLSDNLYPDFIRGYFDGNGSIYQFTANNVRYAEIKICSSKDFCIGLNEYLKTKNIWSYTDKDNRTSDGTGQFRIRRKSEIVKFYKYLYENIGEEMYLIRKYLKLKEFTDGIIQKYGALGQ